MYCFQKTHGSPDGSERHVGDLGNVVTPVGSQVTTVFISDSLVSLDPESEAYVGGRAIVIHGGEDDLGGGGDEGVGALECDAEWGRRGSLW